MQFQFWLAPNLCGFGARDFWLLHSWLPDFCRWFTSGVASVEFAQFSDTQISASRNSKSSYKSARIRNQFDFDLIQFCARSSASLSLRAQFVANASEQNTTTLCICICLNISRCFCGSEEKKMRSLRLQNSDRGAILLATDNRLLERTIKLRVAKQRT